MPSPQRDYSIDRLGPVPPFYVRRPESKAHTSLPANTVYAPTGTHDTPGWVAVGVVSRQAPFGQGGSLGFKHGELRPATAAEVKAALGRDDPWAGPEFRPNSAEFALAKMALDTQRGRVNQATERRLSDAVAAARARHLAIMNRWPEITKRQIAAVLAKLG